MPSACGRPGYIHGGSRHVRRRARRSRRRRPGTGGRPALAAIRPGDRRGTACDYAGVAGWGGASRPELVARAFRGPGIPHGTHRDDGLVVRLNGKRHSESAASAAAQRALRPLAGRAGCRSCGRIQCAPPLEQSCRWHVPDPEPTAIADTHGRLRAIRARSRDHGLCRLLCGERGLFPCAGDSASAGPPLR